MEIPHVKIYADGADLESIIALAEDPRISGFTTNPTLMRKAGVDNYESFAHKVLETITRHPISFEVFADEPAEMVRQARLISSWGDNVYVKIPITNTQGVPSDEVIRELSADGVHLNVTALMTVAQVEAVAQASVGGPGHVVSVFAGRIADTGRDPMPIMAQALEVLAPQPELELLWASPREVLNVRQAEQVGVHIITATPDLIAKMASFDKDLDQFSLETVQMFHDDAAAAGYTL
ncbi:MAG TPA: transaldolase [Nocardioides sp.]|uniref:transaldolase n=1 Tax=uncultured Nocardioides sp. TaxID=198441 RepID=UPI0026251DCB|nr:transaldolase [uncultured Nocardioides sp.]HRD61003.1 transaldolase [Nocardioides sp.]HRI94333.1 transaldolase [Nocardioides sp.]HRK44556.1 transaldolase [Nocardioides sp.]